MEQPHDWQRCRPSSSSSSTFSPCSSPKSLCTGKLRTRTKCTVTTTVHLSLNLQPTEKCVYFLTLVRSRVFCFMCACSATCNLCLDSTLLCRLLDTTCGRDTFVAYTSKDFGCDATGVLFAKNQMVFDTEDIAKKVYIPDNPSFSSRLLLTAWVLFSVYIDTPTQTRTSPSR